MDNWKKNMETSVRNMRKKEELDNIKFGVSSVLIAGTLFDIWMTKNFKCGKLHWLAFGLATCWSGIYGLKCYTIKS